METKHLWKKMFTVLVATSLVLAMQSMFLPAAGAVTATIVYVDRDATGIGNGTSWTDAHTDLQNAINSASASNEIWVADGTYYPTSAPYIPGGTDRFLHFALKSGVAVYGGFLGTETSRNERDFETNITILSADIGIPGDRTDNSYHVFFHDTLSGPAIDTTALLDGFVIRDGNANNTDGGIHTNGGGMYNHETSPTIQNCLFTSNSTNNTPGFNVGGGGGMYNYYASPVINQCAFVDNTTGRHGGGILNIGGVSQVLSSTFSGNTAPNGSGGGIYNNSNSVFTDCTINNSSAYQEGGGLLNSSSSSVFTNCTFDSNAITNGQAGIEIFNSGGAPNFINCTVTGANSLSSNAMYSYNSNPVVKNSIFRTGAYLELRQLGTGTTTVTYSVVTSITANPGTGNTEDDPLLDAAGLQDNGGPVETIAIGVGGSAEDSGTATGAPLTDARGVARQTPPSIGAYELISYTVGGEVTGLVSPNEVVLQNNGGDDKTITIDTLYTFATAVENGKSYDVTVLTQPSGVTGQLCTAEGSGTISDANVTNADVNCVNTYTIGGSITGLATGNEVVLQNNNGDNLTVNSSNSSFTFDTALADGSAYSVTVLTEPTTPNQTCTVTNGSGSLFGADVTDVSIACVTETYTIGGSVTGLATDNSVFLQNNGGNNLTLSGNGSFVFTTAIDDGTSYNVTVLAQPTAPNQTCVVTGGSGTLAGENVTTVSITCTTNTYTIGGSIAGLATGNSVVLQNNSGDNLSVSDNDNFTFSTSITDATGYDVTVLTQPTTPNQTCTVTNGSGSLFGADVTDVSIACVTETYTIGGSVTGLATDNSVFLQNNGGNNLTLSGNGSFVFTTAIDDGTSYNVTVLAQPTAPNQTCVVTGGSGTLAGENVTTVSITCTTNTYTIGGSITGLASGNEVVLLNNSGDNLTVSANGNFTFATPLTDTSSFSVTVLTQPTTPNQTCTVTNGSGTLAGGDVSSISVSCVTETYTIGGSVTGLFDGNKMVLQNNGGDELIINANTAFTFSQALDDGSTYDVTISSQPQSTPPQECTVINGTGTLAGDNITDIMIRCGSFPWNMFLPAITGGGQ